MLISLCCFTAVLAASPYPASTQEVNALTAAHFPSPLYAFVWRNWTLVPADRMAAVLGCTAEDVKTVGESMGLAPAPAISEEQWQRSYITIIRRNWHLLPYEQLTQLLGWTPEELAFTLQEDDFLYIKLGLLKPVCPPLRYEKPGDTLVTQARSIASALHRLEPKIDPAESEPLFAFVRELSELPQPSGRDADAARTSLFSPRYCYSYFATYGDPLADGALDPYPDGLLARLSQSGANGVWLQAVLYKLSPFPWQPELSEGYEARLKNLATLVARAKSHGISIYLYLNEPRSMPLEFFDAHSGVKGVIERDRAAMCTSVPEVREFITASIERICKAAPELGGFFTITASENLTNCWSHHNGSACERCAKRPPDEVIAEVNATVQAGIDRAGSTSRLIAWDWGWQDTWAPAAIRRLPKAVTHMSVSEWSIPIERGGIANAVGEYSISTVGPGPRATAHWAVARECGLNTIAKIQAGNTWELAAVPYIPALENVAKHAANLRDANVNGLMLGWTLGGYPSPNLEVVAAMGSVGADGKRLSIDEALNQVASRRYGGYGSAVVQAWKTCSTAFSEFPYNGAVVYNAPLQMGPANPLWVEPTNFRATMVGIPYDDVPAWRGNYPEEVFAGQFTKIADGFGQALDALNQFAATARVVATESQSAGFQREKNVIEAASIHFRSVANQTEFTGARDALLKAVTKEEAVPWLEKIETFAKSEQQLALRMYELQRQDSRFGFEASNHYFYVPQDLLEKAINCEDILARWLPLQRKRFEG